MSSADNPFGNADAAVPAGPVCPDGGACPGALPPGQSALVERLDMLFVVDDSRSMREEQAALANQFPRMLRKLVTGDHDEDGTAEFRPVTDLHLGVVSTNMGGTIGVDGCTDGGDDGRLLHTLRVDASTIGAAGLTCAGDYPKFLRYEDAGAASDQVANDFACIALLGTDGCGYEQPLESALKALWPSTDERVGFVTRPGVPDQGRGDTDNEGFLRNSKADGPGTLAIVLVTDEDDCSVWEPRIFTPAQALPSDDPLAAEQVNLRCFFHPEALYPIERYLSAYRGLYADAGGRVVFAAIVGVPVDLVDQPALAKVDWRDPSAREAHYQGILDDPRMQERLDDAMDPPDSLVPSCESTLGRAFPPRRIVELARRFSESSVVQSICGDNLGPPIEIVVREIASPL